MYFNEKNHLEIFLHGQNASVKPRMSPEQPWTATAGRWRLGWTEQQSLYGRGKKSGERLQF